MVNHAQKPFKFNSCNSVHNVKSNHHIADRKEHNKNLVYSDQAVPDYYSTLFSGAARLHTTHLHKRLSIAKAPFQFQAPFIKDVPALKNSMKRACRLVAHSEVLVAAAHFSCRSESSNKSL